MPNFYSWTISTLFLSWLLYPFLHKLLSKLHACGPKLVLFSALVVGIAAMGEARSLGRIGLRILRYTVVVSSIAVVGR